MNVARYNTLDFGPFHAFRLIEDSVNRANEKARPWVPAVDVLETENELVLKADLPAVKLENIDIRVDDGNLTLRGERKFENNENEKGYHRIERSQGSFSRTFTLPDSVQPDGIKAALKEGVLTVTLPKKEIAKPRQIKVEIAS